MSSNKKNFVLRIDEKTFKLLEKWAEDEFRSVNGQIEFLLNQSLLKAGRKATGKSADPKNKEKPT